MRLAVTAALLVILAATLLIRAPFKSRNVSFRQLRAARLTAVMGANRPIEVRRELLIRDVPLRR